ncbi:FAD-binding oxidoreductase [Kribbella sp. CA-294648]|uniref:FAD-binding oxidoreductase n=1 Tax=Kribbella sp. CA-294648 TaxID=3239948 RepID=UPI003D8C1B4B
MSHIDRRTLLKAGGALAAATLTTTGSTPAHAGSAHTTGTTAGPDWTAFQRSLKGRVYRPGQPGYPTVRQLFNPRWDSVQPAAVVRAAGGNDVRAAILFARKNRLVSVPKSGGHSYVGASTVSNGLVVDVSAMRSMSYAGNVLTVGAGAKLYDVHAFLDKHGKSLPTGTCPTVGIAGLTLGGGLGVHTRAFGLTCDRIQSLGVITADGVARNVSATSDPDLFWALRGGGGGNLGIVTSFKLITIPATKLGFFRLTWPESRAADVVRGWQKFAVAAPITAWANLRIVAQSNGTLGVTVLGVSTTGNGAAAAAQLESYVKVKATTRSFAVRTHMEAVKYLGGGTTSARQGFLAGSDVLKPLTEPTIAALVGAVKAAARAKLPAVAIMDPLGGQAAKVPSGGSSWGWRSAVGVVQWYSGLAAHPTSAQLRAAQTFITNGHRAVRPSTAGGYVNYLETGRSVTSYYGANYARLQAVKKKYDPTNFFRTAYTIV